MMKPLCIFHALCQDGFGAAWAVWATHGDEYEYFPGVHQSDPPDVTGRDVVLVDFCYKRPVIEAMLREASSVTILDHHESAQKDLAGLDLQYPRGKLEIVFDMNRSGAMLAWDYFHPDEAPPLLLRHIEDRDLWRFALPDTRAIAANLFSYPYEFEVWDALIRDFEDSADSDQPPHRPVVVRSDAAWRFIADGEAIERKHHKDVAELVAVTKRPMVIGAHLVMACSLPYTLTSDVGHLLAGESVFGACYWDTPDARVFSLRSREGGINVADIASQFGGGGHKHAAGFSVPRDHPLARA